MGVGNVANTGLKSAMKNMEVISNNIANANTVGFKKSSAQFSEIFSPGKEVGLGVKTSKIRQDFSTGRIELTDRSLDLSLNSGGFFIQKNAAEGRTSYTRAGRFDVDKQGYIVGLEGRMQGYGAQNGVILGTDLVDIKIPDTPVPAKATSTAKIGINLDSASTIPSSAFDANDATSYNFRSDTTVYDSLGNPSAMSVFYIKSANNQWDVKVSIDNQNIGNGTASFTNSGALASTTGLNALNFLPTSGAQTPQALALNLTGSTQFAGNSQISSSEQDGYSAGAPSGFNIDGDGKVNVYYSNGRSQVVGQFAVANFKAPQALTKADEMSWYPTTASGEAILNPSYSDGAISVGTLELSNVDLTEELVSLLGAEHDFQANAQVQDTYNKILKTIENL